MSTPALILGDYKYEYPKYHKHPNRNTNALSSNDYIELIIHENSTFLIVCANTKFLNEHPRNYWSISF